MLENNPWRVKKLRNVWIVALIVAAIAVISATSSFDADEARQTRVKPLLEGKTIVVSVEPNWGIDQCLNAAGWTSNTSWTLRERREAVRILNDLKREDALQIGQELKVPAPQ